MFANRKKKKPLNAHQRLLIAFFAAIIAFFTAYACDVNLSTRITLTWITYALTDLSIAWHVMWTFHPLEVKKDAQVEDSNQSFIFLLIITATCISLFTILISLNDQKLSDAALKQHILLSLCSVICSWSLLHTAFALRYAHLYYDKQNLKNDNLPLDFPNEKKPDYLDFAYFSFVIGMTFQVSDVEISSRIIRRLALLHGCISFTFNTFILALTINILAGLFQH